MSTELTIKKGRGVPKDAEMAEAELALDLDDGTLYSKLGDGLVHALNEVPDADNYGHWKLQVDYGTPYEVESGKTANFEGKGGVDVSLAGDTVTVDGSGIVANLDADNYQYWTYKINGFSTTNVLSTQELDFQSGDGIDITREGYGIKISATGGGGSGSSLWEQNGSNIYYNDGNVGVGTDAPAHQLEITSNGTALNDRSVRINSDRAKNVIGFGSSSGAGVNLPNVGVDGTNFIVDNGGSTRLTIDSSGNAGIGTDAPGEKLSVESGNIHLKSPYNASGTENAYMYFQSRESGNWRNNYIGNEGSNLVFATGGLGTDHTAATTRLTIDTSGHATFSGKVLTNNVGSETNACGLRFSAASGGGASTRVVPTDTSSVTDGVIDIGSASGRFKDGWFSGAVNAGNLVIDGGNSFYRTSAGAGGLKFTTLNSIIPTDNTGTNTDGELSLGSNASQRFKDAFFSGTVNAGSAVITTRNVTGAYGAGFLNSATDTGVILTDNGSAFCPTEDGTRSLGSTDLRFRNATFSGTVSVGEVNVATNKIWRAGFSGFQFTDSIRPLRGDGTQSDGDLSIGTSDQRFKDGWFSGTVDAGGFTVNGVPIGGGASGNFVDKDTTTAQTIKSTLTGPDFIASSDERLKDNITTAPVGLIDSLKGREWDWKESGEKGSGVIAQELEEVLPHLVHEDESGMKSVSYMGLCAYLIEEVKALRAEVEALK